MNSSESSPFSKTGTSIIENDFQGCLQSECATSILSVYLCASVKTSTTELMSLINAGFSGRTPNPIRFCLLRTPGSPLLSHEPERFLVVLHRFPFLSLQSQKLGETLMRSGKVSLDL